MESWDDENFDPRAPTISQLATNKWVGEDEEDEVKESWEDEEDEEKKEESAGNEVQQKTKKKPLAERIAEKERQKREEMERRLREEEEEMSPEERLRRQKESDLKLALETTFVEGERDSAKIDDLGVPDSKEEFDTFTDALSKKLTPLSRSVEYPNFVENLARNLCATMTSLDIKKINNSLNNLYLEKQKIEKGDKSKKSKGKGKARLKMEGDNQLSQLSAYTNDYDEFDDFM
ncbi:hypothetical protein JTB14_012010 [Gonioctena quinquepunctata]|nr:hypothetical protein JTB14_012010 [Gonioctena quinquepunctata]